MTHMNRVPSLPVEVLAGGALADILCKPLRPYSEDAVQFLSALSQRLLNAPEARVYPDIAGFAFWCRRANLARLSQDFNGARNRLGRGLVFHIAPANVPVNFAFSFAFGLLAGNANIVRVPGANHPQTSFICAEIAKLLERPEYRRIAQMTRLIRYPREDAITEALSAACHARVLWGGDSTIGRLRSMWTSPRCVDVCFADRYSICMIDAKGIISATMKALDVLIAGFYNDVFLLDQNACSSPHLILWQGSNADITLAQEKFWQAMELYLLTKQDPIPAIHAIDKYVHACRTSILLEGCSVEESRTVYRVWLDDLPQNIEDFRGGHGFFFEAKDDGLKVLESIVSERYQTVTYFGVDPQSIIDRVIDAGLSGVDRVVPIGKALDIGVIWDGYDLIGMLSRILSDT